MFSHQSGARLIQSIDRFSEDLDFDCKDLSESEFMVMTDCVVQYLRQNNVEVETRDKPNPHLTAFRHNLYFPQMLFNLGLTGHREERLLLKIEAQIQKKRDFMHLLFNESKANRILQFAEVVAVM
jgi:hypothetical protein